MTGRLWIHGLGRSGTSWVLKIFDHHPETLASHEPEMLMALPPDDRGPMPRADLDAWLEQMFASRALRAMRVRPILTKDYRSAPAHLLRKGLIYGAAGAGQALRRIWSGAQPLADRVPIPDLASRAPALTAVKSVARHLMLDQAIAQGVELKVLYLLRHPCGNVVSNLRGAGIGRMPVHYLPPNRFLERMMGPGRAAEMQARADEFDQLDNLALRWSVLNGAFVEAARTAPQVRVLKYEDLCDDPIGVARDLFAWVGLDWHPRAEAFLQASLGASGDAPDGAGGYHTLTRNPAVAARKWQTEMDPADIERVLEICADSPAFAHYR